MVGKHIKGIKIIEHYQKCFKMIQKCKVYCKWLQKVSKWLTMIANRALIPVCLVVSHLSIIMSHDFYLMSLWCRVSNRYEILGANCDRHTDEQTDGPKDLDIGARASTLSKMVSSPDPTISLAEEKLCDLNDRHIYKLYWI